uniref:Predicted protein n=1 Tax=Hordeum vulgare subsp. vulgare TaxID=112509 RepID=F2DLX8_HORVV|nr:predicted protein [Hordeum vulgare subsp. vulgare]
MWSMYMYLHHHDGVVGLDGPEVGGGVGDEVLLGEQQGALQEPDVLQAALGDGLREVDAVGGAADGGAPLLRLLHDAPRQRVEEGQRLAQRLADHAGGRVGAGPEDVHRLHQAAVGRVPVHPRQRQRVVGRLRRRLHRALRDPRHLEARRRHGRFFEACVCDCARGSLGTRLWSFELELVP